MRGCQEMLAQFLASAQQCPNKQRIGHHETACSQHGRAMQGAPERSQELAGAGVVHSNGIVAGRSKLVPAIAEAAVAAGLHWVLRQQPARSHSMP